jgi:MYXO-CTERM domain-containing protein
MPTVEMPRFLSPVLLAGVGVLIAGAGAARAATVDFECLPDSGAGGIVGTAPLAVYCEVVAPAEGSWGDVTWTVGDGTVLHGDQVSYRYLEPGQYTVSVELDGYSEAGDEDSEDTSDPRRTRHGFVTICGEPEPEFTFINHGELDIEAVNLTPITVSCTEHLRWELFRGEPTGEPLRVWELWEPRFTLPEEGEYTLRLTVSGLAGTGAAELRFDGVHKLTEDLTNGPKAAACATGATGGGPWLALAALAALGLRRRRG